MTSMNISLPEELREYVEAQAKNGYSTPSEYLRGLIRQDREQKSKEKLDALLLEGLNSGASIPMNAKFWAEVKHEALARLRRRKKTR